MVLLHHCNPLWKRKIRSTIKTEFTHEKVFHCKSVPKGKRAIPQSPANSNYILDNYNIKNATPDALPDININQHPTGIVVHPSGRPCRKWTKKDNHATHNSVNSQRNKTLKVAMTSASPDTCEKTAKTVEPRRSGRIIHKSGWPCSKQPALQVVTNPRNPIE